MALSYAHLALLSTLCFSALTAAQYVEGVEFENGDKVKPGARIPHNNYVLAHGIMMALAFGVFFPLGGVVLRGSKSAALHGLWQLFTLSAVLAAFGIGAWMATVEKRWTTNRAHPILGTIIVAFLLVLPLGGQKAHSLYKKQGPNSAGKGHKMMARFFIILGYVNGGLGIWLAGSQERYIITYCVIGGIFIIIWIVVAAMSSGRLNSGPGSSGEHSIGVGKV